MVILLKPAVYSLILTISGLTLRMDAQFITKFKTAGRGKFFQVSMSTCGTSELMFVFPLLTFLKLIKCSLQQQMSHVLSQVPSQHLILEKCLTEIPLASRQGISVACQLQDDSQLVFNPLSLWLPTEACHSKCDEPKQPWRKLLCWDVLGLSERGWSKCLVRYGVAQVHWEQSIASACVLHQMFQPVCTAFQENYEKFNTRREYFLR